MELKANNKLIGEEPTLSQHDVFISIYSKLNGVCGFSSYESYTHLVMFILSYFMVSCWEWILYSALLHSCIFRLVRAGTRKSYNFKIYYLFNGHPTKLVLSYTPSASMRLNLLGFASRPAHHLQLIIILPPPFLILLYLLQLPT